MSNQKVKLGKYLKKGQLSILNVALMTVSSVLLTVVALVLISQVFPNLSNVSEFTYESVYGLMIVYNFASLLSLALFAIFNPAWVLFEDMRSNRWYYLLRMGFPSSKIIGHRLQTRYIKPFISYIVGAIVSMGIGAILGLAFYINGLVAVIGFGLVNYAVFLSVLCLFGVTFKSRVGSGFAIAATWLAMVAVNVSLKFHVMTDRYETAMRYADAMRLSGASYLVCASVLLIVMTVIFYFVARDKCAFYTSNPPKTALLEKMGVVSKIKVHDGKNVVSEGVEFSSRKDQKKTDTMMLNLTTAKAESSRPRKNKNKPSKNKKTEPVVDTTAPRKKGRALKIVLSSIALVLLLAISFTSLLLKDVKNGPRGAFGVYAVIANQPVYNGAVGDALLFVSGKPEKGEYVLYQPSGSYDITVVTEVKDGGYVLSNGKTVSAKQISGIFVANSDKLKTLIELLNGRVGLIVGVVSFLGAVAVLVLGIIINPTKKQKQPAAVKGE